MDCLSDWNSFRQIIAFFTGRIIGMLTICTQIVNRIFRLKCIAILAGAACGRHWANTGWFSDHVGRTYSIWNAAVRSYLICSWPIGRSINVEGENAHRNCIVLLHLRRWAFGCFWLNIFATIFSWISSVCTFCVHFRSSWSIDSDHSFCQISINVKCIFGL